MSKVLVLNSSALGGASVSKQLADGAIAKLRAQDPHLQVVTRDIGATPVPHLTTDGATAIRGAEPANAAQAATQALSNELIGELKAADTIIIGAPGGARQGRGTAGGAPPHPVPPLLLCQTPQTGTGRPLKAGRLGRRGQGPGLIAFKLGGALSFVGVENSGRVPPPRARKLTGR